MLTRRTCGSAAMLHACQLLLLGVHCRRVKPVGDIEPFIPGRWQIPRPTPTTPTDTAEPVTLNTPSMTLCSEALRYATGADGRGQCAIRPAPPTKRMWLACFALLESNMHDERVWLLYGDREQCIHPDSTHALQAYIDDENDAVNENFGVRAHQSSKSSHTRRRSSYVGGDACIATLFDTDTWAKSSMATAC